MNTEPKDWSKCRTCGSDGRMNRCNSHWIPSWTWEHLFPSLVVCWYVDVILMVLSLAGTSNSATSCRAVQEPWTSTCPTCLASPSTHSRGCPWEATTSPRVALHLLMLLLIPSLRKSATCRFVRVRVDIDLHLNIVFPPLTAEKKV